MKRQIALILAILFALIIPIQVLAENTLSDTKLNKLEEVVHKIMKQGGIPGVSVVVVQGERTIYKKGFGYSDIMSKKPVTPKTLFELGSTSKAFTALAILNLEKKGLINLNDAVDKYLPWLKFTYNGKEQKITIEQMLHHTSGIPFKSIAKIPSSKSEDALEKTVETLINTELDNLPGKVFSYATINYDVLGLIIKKVSGTSFEKYMKNEILGPMGLDDIYLFRQEASLNDFSKGYKIAFLKPREFDAPLYRGNTPAGYFIVNADDAEKWLKIQLGALKPGNFDWDLILKSHEPNRGINVDSSGVKYAAGWFVNENSKKLFHGGNNPNFSSQFTLDQQTQVGIAVFANINSAYTESIAIEIENIFKGEDIVESLSDQYQDIDRISTAVIFIGTFLILAILAFTIILFLQLQKGKRKLISLEIKKILVLTSSLVFLAIIGYCLYEVPRIFVDGTTWGFLKVWAPSTMIIAAIEIIIVCILLYLYLVLSTIFKKIESKPYLAIISFSVLSGLGNALIIFMINETFEKGMKFQLQIFIYFMVGILLYVFGLKISGTKLVNLTNDIAYKLRTDLSRKILSIPYEEIEKMDKGKIQAAMNNDTEIISNVADLVNLSFSSLITLICCFVYLGILSFYGLILSALILLLIASIYFLAGRSAGKLMDNSRDIQNVFLRFINDMECGIKELRLNSKKRIEFQNDMEQTCNTYRKKRVQAALKFINVNVIGGLLFNLALGAVAFMFPIIFKEIQTGNLRSYIFVLLYMTGPVHGIMSVIPNIVQVNVSLKRVNEILKTISAIEVHQTKNEIAAISENDFVLELKDVEYQYKSQNGDRFTVGPISCIFRTGEISFITGGNGSGKSTLAKLITGLYTPSNGFIKLKGKKISSEALGQYFSTIFSDFYIFDKLYGVDSEEKKDEINKYLKILRIDDKLDIKNGTFSTTKLSTGQRKRLALMISYLEDKPFCLFDEWAADQDPEFRHFFYIELLPELKKRGKCIIAITHDDRYFHQADNLIKMELGKLLEEVCV